MLIVCPTPLGNLDDISSRQRKALAEADIIACEDTRRTGKLLALLGEERREGRPRLVSVHEHNEEARVGGIVEALAEGQKVVLVSDAGTPTISDPGYQLVRAVAERGFRVEALPGPCAATTALSAAGLPAGRFFFEGFLPSKGVARRARLEELRGLGVTVVCYESPRRLKAALEDVRAVFGDVAPVVVGRELTKLHEEFVRGSAVEVLSEFVGRPEIRGEVVLVLGAGEREAEDLGEVKAKIAELLEAGMRPRGIKEVIAEVFDVPRSAVYGLIEAVKERAR